MGHIRIESPEQNGRAERITRGLAHSRSLRNFEGTYQMIRYEGGGNTRDQTKTFAISGDCIFVAENNGGGSVYLRMGYNNNPWIRIQRGAIYRRKFDRFSLKTTNESSEGGDFTDVTLYISYGPLVENFRPNDGLDGGAVYSANAVSITLARSFAYDTIGQMNKYDSRASSYGKMGGLVVIKNIDSVNRMFIGNSATPGLADGGTSGFPIDAGETFTTKLNSRVGGPETIISLSDLAKRYLLTWTLSGTCKYAYIISPGETDWQDIYNRRAGEIS
jgi:hypothetical protein